MSFFRYPGGKSKFKKIIIDKIIYSNLDVEEYREPFFGGGSIGCSMLPYFKKTWFNDFDIALYCLWYSTIYLTEKFSAKIENYIPSTDDYYKFKSELLMVKEINPDDQEKSILDIGFKKLVLHQTSYSGLGVMSGGPIGGINQTSNYKINCRWTPKSIISKINKITNSLIDKELNLSNIDYKEVIEDEKNKAFVYLDPPYFDKGPQLYQHSFSLQQHTELSELLKNTKHNWLLSYDDCKEVRKLYDWANIIELSNISYTINSKHDNKKTELLICNYD